MRVGKAFALQKSTPAEKANKTACVFFAFHLLKDMFDFPLLVFKGIYHYWAYLFIFSRGLTQMEVAGVLFTTRAFQHVEDPNARIVSRLWEAAEDVAYRELCVKYMLQLCVLDVNEAREFHNRQRAFGTLRWNLGERGRNPPRLQIAFGSFAHPFQRHLLQREFFAAVRSHWAAFQKVHDNDKLNTTSNSLTSLPLTKMNNKEE